MPAPRCYIAIDGKFRECVPTLEYGYLGTRFTCTLGGTPGQPEKRLLIRHVASADADGTMVQLKKRDLPLGSTLSSSPLVSTKYELATSQPGEKLQRDHRAREVLQQDISGLISLKEAILGVLKKGDLASFWALFYHCRKTLDRFSQTVGVNEYVPLQLPQSLAVGPRNRVVPLDAEVQFVAPLPVNSQLSQVYADWFGNDARTGNSQPKHAPRLHALALLRYFRGFLAQLDGKVPADIQAVVSRARAQADQVRPEMSLDELKAWIRELSEDWELLVDDEDGGTEEANSPELISTAPRKRWSLLRMSLWMNLFFVCLLSVLFWFWPKSSGGTALSSSVDSEVLYSSYCVVFRMEGTAGESVVRTLRGAFPGRIKEVDGTPDERERLLRQKLEESVKTIEDHGAVKQVLAKLVNDSSVEFKGFANSDPPDRIIAAVIKRGGVFTVGADKHASLLQANGLELVLRQGHLDERERLVLTNLRRAVADYASLEDALSMLAERGGVIVQVAPSREGHETLRRELVGRVEKPVFVSRPLSQVFGAVDPSADTGGGLAEYSLQLDRLYYLRIPSLRDRDDLATLSAASKARMNWREVKAGDRITWTPLPVIRKGGDPAALSSFDVAVVTGRKVVLFRNQSILVGMTKEQILEQGGQYIRGVLRLPVQSIDEAISVSERRGQFTGALKYSYLAGLIANDTSAKGTVLQVLDKDKFADLRVREDTPKPTP